MMSKVWKVRHDVTIMCVCACVSVQQSMYTDQTLSDVTRVSHIQPNLIEYEHFLQMLRSIPNSPLESPLIEGELSLRSFLNTGDTLNRTTSTNEELQDRQSR